MKTFPLMRIPLLTLIALLAGCGPGTILEDYSAETLDNALSAQDYDTTVQQLTQLPYLPWAYTPDGCYARATYYSMLIASKSVPSNHLYIIAQRGTYLADQWWYHVAPMVTKDTDPDNLWVLDPVFEKTRAVTPVEWAAAMGHPNPSATTYPSFHVNPGNSYAQVDVPGIAVTNPADPNVALLKEPTFAALGQFAAANIQEACLVMHEYIDLEPGLTSAEKAAKHVALGQNTRTLVTTLSTLGKLGGSTSTLTTACLGVAPTNRSFAATGLPKAIPDNSSTGISSAVVVDQAGTGTDFAVDVDIQHPYIGDLRVKLRAPSGSEFMLQDRSGGSADNIVKTFAVAGLNGTAIRGTWTLLVYDLAGSDVGSLRAWTLRAYVADTVNLPPVAQAGAAQQVTVGKVVTLNGTASSDPNGDPLTYRWTQTAGEAVTLSSATSATLTFTAPATPQTLTFSLVVNDGKLDSPAATTTVTVTAAPVVIEATATDTPKAIPDNNSTGITSTIPLTNAGTVADLQATVAITHPYSGDLIVTLKAPVGTLYTLQSRSGGSADNINKTFTVAGAVGKTIAGNWVLTVSDRASQDIGTLQTFKLTIRPN